MTSIHTWWPGPVHWAPDSQSIAFADSDYGLQITDLEGTVTQIASPYSWIDMAQKSFDWSPDGTRIAYVDKDLGFDDNATAGREPSYVMLVSLDGSVNRQISPPGSDISFGNPQWLTNNALLVVGWDSVNLSWSLYRIDLGETELQNYSSGLEIDTYELSPYRLWVALIINSEIWLLDLETEDMVYITTIQDEINEDTPNKLFWFPDASYLVLELEKSLLAVKLIDGHQTWIDASGEISGIDIR